LFWLRLAALWRKALRIPRVVLPLLLTLSCSLFADQVVLKKVERVTIVTSLLGGSVL
jgi:hypothetical protein